MTQPLPNPTSKAATAASSRLDIGNFFQLKADFADFDALLTNEDWQDRSEKSQEQEQERRKKIASEVVCADAIAALKSDPLLQSRPDAENSPAHLAQASQDAEAAEDQIREQNVEAEKPDEASQQPPSEEKSPVANGMEVASDDAEMISLTTFDEPYTASAPLVREPLVTTSVRLTVSAATNERANLSPIIASSNDNGSSPSLQGNPNQTALQEKIISKPASQTASSVLKDLPAELEKFRQSGQSQVQIELNIGKDENLKVRLQMRAGELRSTFITDSQELREALQKAWPEFAQDSRERGFHFGNPSFQNAFSQNGSSSRGNQQSADQAIPFDLTPSSKSPVRHTTTPVTKDRTALWA